MLKLVNPRQRLSPRALVHGNSHQTHNSEDTGEPSVLAREINVEAHSQEILTQNICRELALPGLPR